VASVAVKRPRPAAWTIVRSRRWNLIQHQPLGRLTCSRGVFSGVETLARSTAGFSVNEIGFGCVGLSDPYRGERMSDVRATEVLMQAVATGVNVFDTASMYGGGHNERVVGVALAQADASTDTKSTAPTGRPPLAA
jgi:hypothetical protein